MKTENPSSGKYPPVNPANRHKIFAPYTEQQIEDAKAKLAFRDKDRRRIKVIKGPARKGE